MTRTILFSKSFKKQYKLAEKRGLDITKLDQIITLLANDIELDPSLRDHELRGKFLGTRECHIESDWLLLYRKVDKTLSLILIKTGTHSDIFKK